MGWDDLAKKNELNRLSKFAAPTKRRKSSLNPKLVVYRAVKSKRRKTPVKPYAHQKKASLLFRHTNYIFDMSDPGTGKTFAHLLAWHKRRQAGGGKLLIFCPKSIQYSAWAAEVLKFFPGEYTISLVGAAQKEAGFIDEAQIVVVNHDGVNWLAKVPNLNKLLADYDTIIFDESDAYKHGTSQRSKSAQKIARLFKYRANLSATPFNKTVAELWHQVYLLDDGELFGTSFFKFRAAVATPIQTGSRPEMRDWVDKPGIEQEISTLMSSFTLRNAFDECLDIPKNVIRRIPFILSEDHMRMYLEMKAEAVLETKKGCVTAVNAAVLAGKLLQITSGAVYDENHEAVLIDSDRYILIATLVKERKHSVVFFNWKHQKKLLIEQFEKEGITYAVIDGSVSNRRRAEVVEEYQEGRYQTLLLHPKSAAHGLTLTRGKTTIWAYPERNPVIFKQGNHRIYRAGQTERTETIMIEAENTCDVIVGEIRMTRTKRMVTLLDLIS